MIRMLVAVAFTGFTSLTLAESKNPPEPGIPKTGPAPAIVELKGVKPLPAVFKPQGVRKPIEIKSVEDATKHFDEKVAAELAKKVDFGEQIVLVFAWRGSGQDKLTYEVAESFPEQITFTRKPGRTRDLRPHVHVYALRKNVKWSTK